MEPGSLVKIAEEIAKSKTGQAIINPMSKEVGEALGAQTKKLLTGNREEFAANLKNQMTKADALQRKLRLTEDQVRALVENVWFPKWQQAASRVKPDERGKTFIVLAALLAILDRDATREDLMKLSSEITENDAVYFVSDVEEDRIAVGRDNGQVTSRLSGELQRLGVFAAPGNFLYRYALGNNQNPFSTYHNAKRMSLLLSIFFLVLFVLVVCTTPSGTNPFMSGNLWMSFVAIAVTAILFSWLARDYWAGIRQNLTPFGEKVVAYVRRVASA